MIIANPIYDTVFKYLMQDNDSAKLLISLIIGKEVKNLDFAPQEVSGEIQYFSIFRLDFKATITDNDGKETLVLIEIQKIKFSSDDVFRFRKYLGEQYYSEQNTDKNGKPLPIITIYILGHYLDNYQYRDYPVIKVKRQYIDQATETVLEGGKSDFIEMLTHDCVIIQLPALKKKKNRSNDLEKVLDIFDLVKKRQIEVNEQMIPPPFVRIVKRLEFAAIEPELQKRISLEEEIVNVLKEKESEIEARDAIIEQEKQRAEQEKQRAEKRTIKMIQHLLKSGLSKEEIIQVLELDENFLQKYKHIFLSE